MVPAVLLRAMVPMAVVAGVAVTAAVLPREAMAATGLIWPGGRLDRAPVAAARDSVAVPAESADYTVAAAAQISKAVLPVLAHEVLSS